MAKLEDYVDAVEERALLRLVRYVERREQVLVARMPERLQRVPRVSPKSPLSPKSERWFGDRIVEIYWLLAAHRHIQLLGTVEDGIVECFRYGGRVPFSAVVEFAKIPGYAPGTVVQDGTRGATMALAQEEIAQFLAERRNAVLGTIRKDGSPQLNPMWFYWTGDVFHISTTRTRFKYGHLQRDSRVTLCIDDATGYKTVIAEGRAMIVETDIWGPTRKIVEKYVAPAQVEARMARLQTEPRVLLVIHPEKWISWDLAQRVGPPRQE